MDHRRAFVADTEVPQFDVHRKRVGHLRHQRYRPATSGGTSLGSGLAEGASASGGQCSRPLGVSAERNRRVAGRVDHHLAGVLDVELGAQIRSRIGGDDRPRVVGTSLMSGVWRGTARPKLVLAYPTCP
jgi:hypothetical protein